MITAKKLAERINKHDVGGAAAAAALKDAGLVDMAETIYDYVDYIRYDPNNVLFSDEVAPVFDDARLADLAEAEEKAAELLNAKLPELDALKAAAMSSLAQEDIKALYDWLYKYGLAFDFCKTSDLGDVFKIPDLCVWKIYHEVNRNFDYRYDYALSSDTTMQLR